MEIRRKNATRANQQKSVNGSFFWVLRLISTLLSTAKYRSERIMHENTEILNININIKKLITSLTFGLSVPSA